MTHLGLPVTNLERSVDFYGEYAGMQVVHRREGVVWLSDLTRPFVIVLIETPWVPDPLRPIGHLGVGCATREEVDRLCAKAEEEGVLLTGPKDDAPPIGYWALMRDPDGHTLEVSHGQEIGLAVEASESDTAQRPAVSPRDSHSA